MQTALSHMAGSPVTLLKQRYSEGIRLCKEVRRAHWDAVKNKTK